MKWGLRWMDKYAAKYREWVILLGYIGVGAGYVGGLIISVLLIKNLIDILASPQAASGVALVLPGVNLPGIGILPFWYWLIAIFVIAVVHEFAHGIVARAHKIQVKNTGFVFFGPIIGAFVEPNENKLRSQSDITQYSVLAAGAFSNIILALIGLLLLQLVFLPIQGTMVESNGFTFDAYVNDNLPLAEAGIQPGTIISGLKGTNTPLVKITNFEEFYNEVSLFRPGEEISLQTETGLVPITLAAHPDNPIRGYLGINQIRNDINLKEKYSGPFSKSIFYVLEWFTGMTNGNKGFLFWIYVLSLGIGLFNLLPLPIVDGGRMAQVFLHRLKGKALGEKRYRQISLFFLLLLLLNLVIPFFTKLLV